jgi:Flp pilus assembly CpaE family ATPase
LYLDVKPAFTVYDALRNLHRLDIALLESFVTPARSGLNLLAGTVEPQAAGGSAPEFAKLFDLLVNAYSHVVVDLSTRQDAVARTVAGLSDLVLLVAQTDVASLWSAGHLYQRFLEAETRERVRLILNRFRRMPGFRDSDAEIASGAKLLAKIPNNYALVAGAVDRGLPLVTENHSDVARAMADLATALVHPEENRSKTFSLFRRAV